MLWHVIEILLGHQPWECKSYARFMYLLLSGKCMGMKGAVDEMM